MNTTVFFVVVVLFFLSVSLHSFNGLFAPYVHERMYLLSISTKEGGTKKKKKKKKYPVPSSLVVYIFLVILFSFVILAISNYF